MSGGRLWCVSELPGRKGELGELTGYRRGVRKRRVYGQVVVISVTRDEICGYVSCFIFTRTT